MTTALLISGVQDGKTAELLRRVGVDKVYSASSCGEGRRLIGTVDFDIILINAPLPDENGIDFALTAADRTFSAILLLVKNDFAELIQSKVESMGVAVLGKPVTAEEITRYVRLLLAVQNRYTSVKKENSLLKNKLEEVRTVNRAKLLLIEALHMTEDQAHKFIEKQAMDLRITRKAVAERIIMTYEQ